MITGDHIIISNGNFISKYTEYTFYLSSSLDSNNNCNNQLTNILIDNIDELNNSEYVIACVSTDNTLDNIVEQQHNNSFYFQYERIEIDNVQIYENNYVNTGISTTGITRNVFDGECIFIQDNHISHELSKFKSNLGDFMTTSCRIELIDNDHLSSCTCMDNIKSYNDTSNVYNMITDTYNTIENIFTPLNPMLLYVNDITIDNDNNFTENTNILHITSNNMKFHYFKYILDVYRTYSAMELDLSQPIAVLLDDRIFHNTLVNGNDDNSILMVNPYKYVVYLLQIQMIMDNILYLFIHHLRATIIYRIVISFY
jgi:hypothetical protein